MPRGRCEAKAPLPESCDNTRLCLCALPATRMAARSRGNWHRACCEPLARGKPEHLAHWSRRCALLSD